MPDEAPLERLEPIRKEHELEAFNCGVAALNDYLKRHALQNHQNRSARTYVATRGLRIVAYYTLAAGSVDRATVPARIAKGLGQYPVPVILLARLAVDVAESGKGFGKGLLKDALLRIAQAADIIGCRAVLVHAKDQTAQKFYTRFGFEASPVDDLHLYLLMKDIQLVLGGEASKNQ
jgi:GNAT superfamily N-acetyltransferase